MKKTKLIMLAAITALYAVQGMAGVANEAPVIVDLELRTALGAQTTARFADNENELIGCGATVRSDGVNPVLKFGFCQATDAEGVSAACFTQDPELVDAINSIANYGFISFGWNENDECVSVRNSTQSFYIPDFKQAKSKKSKK
jgi:hypothetical protein